MKVNKLRFCNVLPSAILSEMSKKRFAGITINDRDAFQKEGRWWKYEEYLDIHFGDVPVEGDITQNYSELCQKCRGQCCKDLPTHNIGMYTSETESKRIGQYETDFLEGQMIIEKHNFGVIKVKENGDCHFLTEDGCKIGDDRPLWCQLWVCSKLQNDRADKELKK